MRSWFTRSLYILGLAVLAAALGIAGWAWNESRLPGRYNVMDFGTPEYGGGPRESGHHSGAGEVVSVADLRGPQGRPDVDVTLTAMKARVRLASGKVVDAWTFNGGVPAPTITARRGDLVRVMLLNRDIEAGVTVHWHGVDVPNGEDGVAGVTQGAVRPGERYVYRFRVEQTGSFWYHSHQVGSQQVRRGLYGLLRLLPRAQDVGKTLDVPVLTHNLGGRDVVGTNDGEQRRAVTPGTSVRLRLVNTDNFPRRYFVSGTSFRVAAIDGTDLNAPPPIADQRLEVGAGGRYDVTFVMPPRPVALGLVSARPTIVLDAGTGDPDPPDVEPKATFDPTSYGEPAATPFGPRSQFDRRFTMTITRKPGFFDGRPGLQWAVNGEIYPRTPMFMVRNGDLVKMTIVNKTGAFHPMHLHGHHMLVLSRNGRLATGSPWWVDTLNVGPKERYDAAFRADNPGLWMDHCHNLSHAAKGLTMHVAYEGVETPFEAGDDAGNQPE